MPPEPSVHGERWVNPEVPTAVKPFEATQYQHASIPAVTFGHLTHTSSANTVWDVRVGRFDYSQETSPSTGNRTTPSRTDLVTGVWSGAPQQVGTIKQIRSTVKATISHYQTGRWGADHEWKMGGQFDRGEHRALLVIPTGVRFNDRDGQPSQVVFSDPSNAGGLFITAAAFAIDALTVGTASRSMPACGSITAAASVRTCARSMPKAAKPRTSSADWVRCTHPTCCRRAWV